MNKNTNHNKSFRTLIELLDYRALTQPNDVAYRFLFDSTKNREINFFDLQQGAKKLAGRMQANGSKLGDRTIIIYPPGIELILAYFACLYAGTICIPVYPPTHIKLVNKLKYIIDDAQPNSFISSSEFKNKLSPHMSDQNILFWLESDIVNDLNNYLPLASINSHTLAFLQYTSGSTHQPKGVKVSHENLLHNLKLLSSAFDLKHIETIVSWLPPYHDMGLITGILLPIYRGIPAILMSPNSFLLNPFLWLSTISQFTHVFSGAPNFAYNYCIKKISNEQKQTLDLSHWDVAFNGAEPIHKTTLIQFIDTFKPSGFKPSSLYPCYGLAEATLMVSSKLTDQLFHPLTLSKEALRQQKIILNVEDVKDAHSLISIGHCFQTCKIVNLQTHLACSENEIGEIWIRGKSVTQGYWNKPELTHEIFHAKIVNDDSSKKYLRTGDLGFIHDNELYITGRIKDLIILNGQNYYPQDIEYVVEQAHKNIRQGCCAAFSIDTEESEGLAIICEVQNDLTKEHAHEIIHAILHALASEELTAHYIGFIPAKSLPKTTSGKVMRQPCKKDLQEGKLPLLYSWQAPKINGNNENVRENSKLDNYNEITNKITMLLANTIHQPIANIDPTLPFIEFGLDSILSVQLIHALSEMLNISIDPLVVWDYPTPNELGHYLQKNIKTLPPLNQVKFEPTNQIQLSPFQEQILIPQLINKYENHYNLGIAIRFNGDLSLDLLKQTLTNLLNRHTILRTYFKNLNGKMIPCINNNMSPNISSIDLSLIHSKIDDTFLENYFTEIAMKPYQLSEDDLIRFFLIKTKTNFYLLLAAHHLIIDGYSIDILIREFQETYNSLYNHRLPSLPNLSISYYDYFLLDQKSKDQLISLAMQFWQKELNQCNFNLSLSTDRPRKISHVPIIERHHFKIEENIAAKINKYSRLSKLTPFTLFLSIFQLLLSHYSNQNDLIIGIPISCRNNINSRHLIGLFVNTLPIRLIMNEKINIEELLIKNADKLKSIYSFQELPLKAILKELKIQRDETLQPLFQIVFVMHQNQTTQENENITEQLDMKVNWIESGHAPYDLVLEISQNKTGYQCSFSYDANLFDESTIKRMSEHYMNLVKNLIAANKQTKAWDLSLLNETEYHLITNKWNQNKVYLQTQDTIHELFEAKVYDNKNKLAIIHNGDSLTYSQLNTKSNQLAHLLINTNIKKESHVIIGTCLPNCIDFVIASLAIMKAGFAYLPLDAENPSARISLILHDANPNCIITHSSLTYLFNHTNIQIIELDKIQSLLKSQQIVNPSLPIPIHSLAYIIYTSGSTGAPKGVAVEHRSICNHLKWYCETNLPVDKFLHLFSFNFDGSIASLWWPLFNSGTVIIENPNSNSLMNIIETIKKYKITSCVLTPSLMDALLQIADNDTFKTIEHIALAGEPFYHSLLNKIRKKTDITRTNIWNFYGPTEASIISTYYQVTDNESDNIPIGKPVSSTKLYVLDHTLKPVPIGVIGKLYIGGPCLARGYLNDETLTKKSFINNPFDETEKLYDTGDLVKWLASGNLLYIGRVDNQIKIRGNRIDLSEIEAYIMKHPAVKLAIVIPRHNVDKSDQLITYYTLKYSVRFRDLQIFLRQYLPSRMIPQIGMQLTHFPLTINGKIDNKSLPIPNTHPNETLHPQTKLEKNLVAIWLETLKTNAVNYHDNFFEIGGDSLLGMILTAKIQEKISKNISNQFIFTYQTLSEQINFLAEHIEMASTPTQCIISLNKSSAHRNLFCLHPVGGGVTCYKKLTKHLNNQFNVYGIQAPGLQGEHLQASDLSSLARNYLERIQQVQPHGPYLFLGWSTGGLIAFEIARLIKLKGEKIESLNLIDTSHPLTIPSIIQMNKNVLLAFLLSMMTENINIEKSKIVSLKIKMLLKSLANSNYSTKKMSSIMNKISINKKADSLFNIENDLTLLQQDIIHPGPAHFPLFKWIKLLKDKKFISSYLDNEQLEMLYDVFRLNVQLINHYVPYYYDGKINLFESTSHIDEMVWDSYATDVRKIELPTTNHYHLINDDKILDIITRVLLERG